LRKKAVPLVITLIVIATVLIVVFLGLPLLQPSEQATHVEDLLANPDSYLNKTVIVEGILETMAQPSPANYGLYNENHTAFLYVKWYSETTLIFQYNATSAVVQGVLMEELWTAPNVPINPPTLHVYYLDNCSVKLGSPSE
jgi:hypothetical protein